MIGKNELIDLGCDLLPTDPLKAMKVKEEYYQNKLENIINKLDSMSFVPPLWMDTDRYMGFIIDICEDIYIDDPHTTNEEFCDKFISDYLKLKNLF